MSDSTIDSLLDLPDIPGPRLTVRPMWRRVINFPNLLALVYFLVCGALMWRHPLWRDEAQAFLIARDSPNPAMLLWNMRYEGHPPLWHILLWILTRFTVAPESMQCLHLVMATASVYLVARFSPLPLIAKILFPFGYFTLFEYGVISRNYQLILLLSLALCALWQTRRHAFVSLGLLIGLLALSHVQGLILAAAFGLLILIDSLVTRTGRGAIAKRPWHFIAGFLCAILLAWWAVYVMIPPADSSFARGWTYDWKPQHVQLTLHTLWDAYVPIPLRTDADGKPDIHFWDTSIVPQDVAAKWGTIIAMGSILLLATSWRAILYILVGDLGLLWFMHIKMSYLYGEAGGVRHHGLFFISFIAACWIAWIGQTKWPRGEWRWLKRLLWLPPRLGLIVLLGVQAYAAGIACYFSWNYPFSNSREAAALIRAKKQPGDMLFNYITYFAAPIAAYLPGQEIYLVDEKRWGTFTLWKQIVRPDRDILGRARDLALSKGHGAILIMPYARPVNSAQILGEFTDCIQGDENYYIYRIPPPPPAPSPAAPKP